MVRYYNYCPNCGCDKVESVTTSVTYLVCMNKDCRFAHIVEPPNSMGDKSRKYTTTLSKEDWSKITKNIDVDEINNDSLTSFSSDDSVLDYTQIIKELVYKKDIDKEENNRYKDIWFKYKEEKISAYKYGYEKLKEVEDFSYVAQPIERTLSILKQDIKNMDELDGLNDFEKLMKKLNF